jgi:hypothetical protein
MKHVKLFENFVNEGYGGKWKVEVWGIMPGAPEWELVDTEKGFKNAEAAQDWARKQKQGKSVAYEVVPEEGWIDPAGTWHPDDDDYDPASAYESEAIDEAKSPLMDIVSWLRSHDFKVVSSEKKAGYRKWAEGGKWSELVKDCKSIGAKYRLVDLGSFKEHRIEGPGFTIEKQGDNKVFVHVTTNKKDDLNRKIGWEE